MPSWPIGFEKGVNREAEGATSFFSPVRRFEAVGVVEMLVDAAESKEFFWSQVWNDE